MKSMLLTPFVACAALLTLSLGPARAADPAPTDKKVESVLAKHLEAIGGRATLEKKTSRIIKAAFEGMGMPAPAEWVMIAKAPNKQLMEMEITGLGKMLDGYDGQVGWSKNPFAGLRVKEGQELAKLKRDSDFYRDTHLATTYTNLVAKGIEKVDGKDTQVLEAKPEPTSVERLFFDTGTGLLLRQESEFDAPDGRMKIHTVYSDFRDIDGVKYPHLMKFNFTMPGQPPAEFTITVKEIKHNEPIDDSKFAKPAA